MAHRKKAEAKTKIRRIANETKGKLREHKIRNKRNRERESQREREREREGREGIKEREGYEGGRRSAANRESDIFAFSPTQQRTGAQTRTQRRARGRITMIRMKARARYYAGCE
jgi:hypothetical protein